MKRLIVLILLLSQTALAYQPPLAESWNYTLLKGVSAIHSLDLTGVGRTNVYATTISSTQAKVYVLDLEGRPEFDIDISRKGAQGASREDVLAAAYGDLDGNGFLDIITATEVRISSVLKHPLYRLQRIPDEKGGYFSKYVWSVEDGGFVTSMHMIKYKNGESRLVTSSKDGEIRVYDASGKVESVVYFPGSVWWADPVVEGNRVSAYLVSASDGMYLINSESQVLWQANSTKRFYKALAVDINKDGKMEYVGYTDGRVMAYSMDSGLLWAIGLPLFEGLDYIRGYGGTTRVIIASGGKLFMIEGDGKGAYELDVGEKILSLKYLDSPLGGKLFVGTVKGLRCYNVDYAAEKAVAADQDYGMGLKALGEARFNESIVHAQRAKGTYESIDDATGFQLAQTLENKAMNLLSAQSLTNKAQTEYNNGNYKKSLELINQALEIYAQEDYNTKKTDNPEETLLKNIRDAIGKAEKKVMAASYYSTAEEKFKQMEYNESVKYAEWAAMMFKEVGDASGVEISTKLADLSRESIPKTTTTTIPEITTRNEEGLKLEDLAIYFVLLLAVGVVLIALRSRFRRK